MGTINQPSKRIGIIGGMGPFSSHLFMGHILDYSRDLHGATHDGDFPLISVENVILPGFTAFEFADKEMSLAILVAALKRLESARCDIITIPCNTAHLFYEALQSRVSIPVVHMPHRTVEHVANAGFSRPFVLATRTTVQEHLYEASPTDTNMEILYPSPDCQNDTETLITHLEIGRETESATELFSKITAKAVEAGADSVVLGCTELSFLDTSHCPLPVFDSSRILAHAATSYAYEKL